MTERIHLIVKGNVQGVLFRNFVKKTAKFLGLNGWVRNTPQGNVEVVAEGERDKLVQLAEKCIRGPIMAKVENIKIDWEKPTGIFKDFEVRYH